VHAAQSPPSGATANWPRVYVRRYHVQSIWSDGRHNAFPGIARVGNYYYVTFRNAIAHQSEDGTSKIFVIRSAADDLKKWEKVAEFTNPRNIRDPLVFDNLRRRRSGGAFRSTTSRRRATTHRGRPVVFQRGASARRGFAEAGTASLLPDQRRLARPGQVRQTGGRVMQMKNLPVTLADYKMAEAELRARLREFNPLDNLQPLIAKKIPIFVVQGDIDKAVPYKEHVLPLKERYEAGGGPIAVKLVIGQGHLGSPAFYQCQELIDLVLQQAGVQAK